MNPEGDPVADRAGLFADRFRVVAPKLKALSSIQRGIVRAAYHSPCRTDFVWGSFGCSYSF